MKPDKTTQPTYESQLRRGVEYQDFVCQELHTIGIVLQNMSSKKYQVKQENLLGLEIKFDDRSKDTDRLYIETAEKAKERPGAYWPSGIYRDDHCWLFGIGDYTRFFIFGKNQLQRIDKANPAWLYRPAKDKPTSQGFCIPIEKAEILAAMTVNFKK